MKAASVIWILGTATVIVAAGCGREPSPTGPADIRAIAAGDSTGIPGYREWADRIDNPFYPLIPGTLFTYQGIKDGQAETDRIYVTQDTKTILGVATTVVEDSVFVNDHVQEATVDWYAQDRDGNVWYFGEDTKEFDENGNVTSTAGSWEADGDSARAGIIMKGQPEVRDYYYQEYKRDVAEDRARVMGLDSSVAVPFGHFTTCLRTQETTRLEPDITELKFYAKGVGFVKSVMIRGGHDQTELISVRKR